MFERELEFFIANQEKLVAQYGGQVLVLRGADVAGVYQTPIDAYLAGNERFGRGEYMIQPCEPGASAYTVTLAT